MKYRIFDKVENELLGIMNCAHRFLSVDPLGGVVQLHIETKGEYVGAFGMKAVGDRYVAQQSTGYIHNLDEVWEGDLFGWGSAVFKVEYSRDCAMWAAKSHKNNEPELQPEMPLFKMPSTILHIGNVLTHPELWEDK